MATTIDRQTLLRGPADMSFASSTIRFGADFSVDLVTKWADVMSLVAGRVSRRIEDRYLVIKGRPLEWNNLTVILPYATKNIGDQIFSGTDAPAVITPKNGAPLTVANVAVTKLPSVTLHPSASKVMVGEMEFTGLVANSSDPSLAASFFSFGVPATNAALSAPDLTKIPAAFYSASYNTVAYQAEDGFTLDFNLGLEDDKWQGLTLSKRLTELEVAVKFTPAGLTEALYATLLAWDGKQPGDDGASYDLVLSGDKSGKPKITLSKMMVELGGVNYGRPTRTGEVTMQSIRQNTAGALNALWTITTVP